MSITVYNNIYHYNVFHRDELIKTKAEPVGRMTEHPEAHGQWDIGKPVKMLTKEGIWTHCSFSSVKIRITI